MLCSEEYWTKLHPSPFTKNFHLSWFPKNGSITEIFLFVCLAPAGITCDQKLRSATLQYIARGFGKSPLQSNHFPTKIQRMLKKFRETFLLCIKFFYTLSVTEPPKISQTRKIWPVYSITVKQLNCNIFLAFAVLNLMWSKGWRPAEKLGFQYFRVTPWQIVPGWLLLSWINIYRN